MKIYNSCKEAGLPEPTIQPLDGGVLVTLYKDYLNSEQLNKLGLNERQLKAIQFIKENHKITNSDYQTLCEVSERTALRDLDELINKKLLKKFGEKKGTYYELGG